MFLYLLWMTDCKKAHSQGCLVPVATLEGRGSSKFTVSGIPRSRKLWENESPFVTCLVIRASLEKHEFVFILTGMNIHVQCKESGRCPRLQWRCPIIHSMCASCLSETGSLSSGMHLDGRALRKTLQTHAAMLILKEEARIQGEK